MLRECHRVLKAGGLLAGYTIHTPRGLCQEDLDRAGDLGPSFVAGWEDPTIQAEQTGFKVAQTLDVTARFRESGFAWLAGLEEREEVLREELGDEEYEHEVERKACMIEGIDAGLLRRSFWVFERRLRASARARTRWLRSNR